MWAYIPFLYVKGSRHSEKSYLTFLNDNRNSQNNPAGFYNVVIDRTKMHIEERRSQTLRALRANIGAARDQNAVYGKAIEILKDYRQDVPFIAIYSVEDAAQAGHTGSVCLKLRESLGIIKETAIPKECQVLLAPTSDSPKTIGHWPFARALKEDLVSVNLPSHLKSRDVFDNPGWPEDVVLSAAVACSSQSHGLPRVLTVIGFNTRHPIDEDSRQFALSVSRFIDTGIMAALDAENERSHLQTMERVIRMRTEELANSQARFKSLCDFSPSGVLECSPEGQITYVNDAWKRMTTISSPVPLPYDCFIPSIINASAADIRSQWEQALKLRQSVRMQWQWKHGGSVYSETFPLPSGQVMSVWTDISAHLSYSDKLVDRQRARAEEAEAAQKVQENFISLIQHETRNPVNAILQGTDVVFSCLQNLENLHQSMLNATNKQGLSVEESRQELVYISGLAASSASDIKEVHETVGAIAIAARHQAKIAADLLSQSKMQQGLLTLSPFDFVLLKEVDKILKLFAAQARLAQVSTEIQHDDSINELTVVRADPTRFTQIIVNLVSNSMRFLEMWEGERSLIISLSLCRDRPLLQTTAVDMKSNADSKRTPSDLGENKIFLLCRVRDSGPGLTAEQQSRLFTRFNDVSQNLEQNRLRGGGTGLGLYLSRQLASLQGGEIAADSSEGQGSTFSFYIEVEMGRR